MDIDATECAIDIMYELVSNIEYCLFAFLSQIVWIVCNLLLRNAVL